jgi:hypothetical protein
MRKKHGYKKSLLNFETLKRAFCTIWKYISLTLRSKALSLPCSRGTIRDKKNPRFLQNQRQLAVNKRRHRRIVFKMAATRIHTAAKLDAF